jgi:hypothetical protein
MTLSGRNAFFKAGIVLSAFCAFLVLVVSVEAIPAYSLMDAEHTRRPDGIIQFFISQFLKTNFYAVHTALAAVVLYSFISVTMIYYFFEQTQAPEILFIAFFSVSLSFEAARLILPLHLVYDVSSFYLIMASRTLLFGRYFGIFSLFAASICASGLDVQKSRGIIIVIITATLIITLGIPIDTQTWDSSLNMVIGYTSFFRLIEAATFLLTVISFFIGVNARGSKEYAFIGIGALLALIGRNILLSADTWASPGPGILLLSAGTWFICTRLHKIYLWL